MRVITIQRKEVVLELLIKGEYRVKDDAPISENHIKPYKFMMKQYNYRTRPIFMCKVGERCNFGGAKTDEVVLIELEIPDRFCKIQDYYSWSDFIYFTELYWEYEEFNGCKTVEDFGKYVLNKFKDKNITDHNLVYQVTTQLLRKSWIKAIRKIDENFINKYVNNGGIEILQSISNK